MQATEQRLSVEPVQQQNDVAGFDIARHCEFEYYRVKLPFFARTKVKLPFFGTEGVMVGSVGVTL